MRINQGTRPHREASPRRGCAHLEPLVPGPFEETRRESISPPVFKGLERR